MKFLFEYFSIVFLFLLVSCSSKYIITKGTSIQTDKNQKLAIEPNKLLIGATLNYEELNTQKEVLYLKEFKYLTPANDAKQSRVHPQPNVWNWEKIDEFIQFANKHQLVVRLHGPISPQASKWAKEDFRTAEELETNLTEFATAFAKHFNNEPTVKWMDVVNETILADGTWFGPAPGTDQWENPWLKMGFDENGYPLYILKAFEIATKNATNIQFVYNQNVGMETKMWDKVKETVLYLRQKGYRVDGIGWQAHLLLGAKREDFVDNIDATMVKLSNLIDWAHQNKLAFHVTELDYLVKNTTQLESERQIQKMVYQKLVNVLLAKSKNGEVTLNLWDIGERNKEGTGVFQSIYDSKYNTTPAYKVIKDGLNKY